MTPRQHEATKAEVRRGRRGQPRTQQARDLAHYAEYFHAATTRSLDAHSARSRAARMVVSER